MQCNIDARGKRLRLVSGILVLAAGATMLLVAVIDGRGLWWALAIAMLAGGAFQVFEARTGWCVLRAMGIKTRI